MATLKTTGKMACPNCGAEMNHHGDKQVYPSDAEDIGKVDPATGTLVEEFHSCPKCGGSASRPA